MCNCSLFPRQSFVASPVIALIPHPSDNRFSCRAYITMLTTEKNNINMKQSVLRRRFARKWRFSADQEKLAARFIFSARITQDNVYVNANTVIKIKERKKGLSKDRVRIIIMAISLYKFLELEKNLDLYSHETFFASIINGIAIEILPDAFQEYYRFEKRVIKIIMCRSYNFLCVH